MENHSSITTDKTLILSDVIANALAWIPLNSFCVPKYPLKWCSRRQEVPPKTEWGGDLEGGIGRYIPHVSKSLMGSKPIPFQWKKSHIWLEKLVLCNQVDSHQVFDIRTWIHTRVLYKNLITLELIIELELTSGNLV